MSSIISMHEPSISGIKTNRYLILMLLGTQITAMKWNYFPDISDPAQVINFVNP